MIKPSWLKFLVFSWLISACALLDDSGPKKTATNGLITTPPSYYSTAKAKYLGTKYKENLDRLVERIVRNPKTTTLQFANNISSVGGIGFFTHSATKTPDERYLEVVLATPETFETKGEYSEKIHQLFSRYGRDLLSIVNGDSDIYQDRELSGYGLNLAWRSVIAELAGNRVSMARAIIYFPKERVRSYLRDEINQNDLLADAVIFGEEENGPLTLVSYQSQSPRPDFRPTIREDNLASAPAQSQPVPAAAPPASIKDAAGKIDQQPETAKKDIPLAKEAEPRVVSKSKSPETKAEVKNAPVAQQKPEAIAQGSDTSRDSFENSAAGRRDATTEKLALKQLAETPRADVPIAETKPKPVVATPEPPPAPTVKAPVPVEVKPIEAQLSTGDTKAAALAPASKAPDMPRVKSQETSFEPVKQAEPKPPVETKKDVQIAAPKAKPVVATPEPPPAPTVTAPVPVVEVKPIEAQIPAGDTKAAALAPASKGPVKQAGPPAETKKTEPEIKTSEELRQPAKTVMPSKPADDREKTKAIQEVQPQKTAMPAAPIAKTPDRPSAVEVKAQAPVSTVSKSEMRPAAAVDSPPVAAASTPQQSEGSAKRIEPTVLPPAELKTPPVIRPREEKTPEPIAAKPATARDEKRVVTPAKEVAEETKADLKNQQPISTVIASAAKNEAAPQKSPVPTTTPKETVEEKGSDPKTRSLVLPSAPVTKTLQAAPAAETVKPAAVLSNAKTEPPVVAVKPAAPIAAPANQEKMSEKPIGDQLALLKNKPIEVVPEKKILTRPPPKALEGFIIQLAFNDKEKAQHWAEAMERRGFAVSITEAGADGALRVRLGNFTLRDEAERQLRTFKQDGMNGIIINLPQAFRPEARSSIP